MRRAAAPCTPPPDPARDLMRNSVVAVLRLVAVSIAASIVTAAPLRAQTGAVRGSVSDDAGHPLPGVRVIVVGTTLITESRNDGRFDLHAIPSGRHTLRAQRIGYHFAVQSVDVGSGEVPDVRFVLGADPLALDAVVVSGSFNPASKLESSTAITTFSVQQISTQAPRGTAELLKTAPGFQVMSNSGETGADVTVRGLPVAEQSSFRYVSLREDGLPVFEPSNLLFAFPDAMARLDETVERVEAVRGGSAAVFGSSTPGGIVNLISKTGGQALGGTIRANTATQGMGRLDLNVGGPLAGGWRFNAGGYFRHDRGARDPGFTANEGGQFRVNATREFANGYARIYAKYLNERDVWYLGIPIQNLKNPEAIGGGPAIGDGTMFAKERLTDRSRCLSPRHHGEARSRRQHHSLRDDRHRSAAQPRRRLVAHLAREAAALGEPDQPDGGRRRSLSHRGRRTAGAAPAAIRHHRPDDH